MNDNQIIETAYALNNYFVQFEVPATTEMYINKARELGAGSAKDANTIAWVARTAARMYWNGETKASTFSRKRDERDYLVYKLNNK